MVTDPVEPQPAEVIAQQPAATPKPEETARYWQEKYNGTVGTWQQERDRANKLAIDLSKRNQDYQTLELNLTAERDQFKTEAENANKAKAEFEKKYGQTQSVLDVTLLLGSAEYADVAPLYSGEPALKVLAAMTPEDRKVTLDAAKVSRDAIVTARQATVSEGSVPSTRVNPPEPGTSKVATVKEGKVAVDAAFKKFGKGSPEYMQAQMDYQKLLMNQPK